MRILLDQAVYDMRNKGNIALVQMALRRIHKLWPEASLEVMTDSPHQLKLYCPDAVPVSVFDNHNWSKNREKLEKIHQLLPHPVLRAMLELRDEAKYRGLGPSQLKQQLKTFLRRSQASKPVEETCHIPVTQRKLFDPPDLEQAMQGADIVIGTGGGYLVDSDSIAGHPVLERLGRAKKMGKFTALVGQGVGPINNPDFRTVIQATLPMVDLILVREEHVAIPLLESLGVPRERICMSGDDAVELAYEARLPTLGTNIGVGVRLTGYTEAKTEHLDKIRPVLHQAAAKYDAHLIGIPGSCSEAETDQLKINQLLAGYPKTVHSLLRFESPRSLIKKVGRCRVMVAGTFHGAVFALAQGIPAIGLVKSEEYAIKFNGLADQFGDESCVVLQLDDEQLPEKLAETIDTAWDSAERLRPQLLQATQEQVRLGQEGYQKLFDLYQLYRQEHQEPILVTNKIARN